MSKTTKDNGESSEEVSDFLDEKEQVKVVKSMKKRVVKRAVKIAEEKEVKTDYRIRAITNYRLFDDRFLTKGDILKVGEDITFEYAERLLVETNCFEVVTG